MNAKSVFNSFYVDLVSMKTKSAFLWVALIVGMSFFNMKSVSFIFLTTIISMLFLNGEKGMYATSFAPVNKKSSVYGRYMFAFLAFLFCLATNLIADVVAPYFIAEYIASNLYFYILMSAVFFAFEAVQLPLLYWKGYAKVRIFQYVILVAVLLFVSKVVGEGAIYLFITGLNINVSFALFLLVVSIALWLCSMLVSVRVYKKKDI